MNLVAARLDTEIILVMTVQRYATMSGVSIPPVTVPLQRLGVKQA